MTEPFAKVVRNGFDAGKADAVRACVLIAGCDTYSGGWDECVERADHFNTAARKYAADAIRQASRNLFPRDAGLAPNVHLNAYERQMMARADAIERGEA